MRPTVRISRSLRGNNVANPLRVRDDTLCIPQSVTVAAPGCSITCIESFIANNYDEVTCMEASSLTFLCTTKTLSGLTIGEGGLQCVVADCGTTDYLKIYNICNNIPGAQPRLASTITATVNPTSTSTAFSSSTTAASVSTSTARSSSSSSSLSSSASSSQSQFSGLQTQTQSINITQTASQTNNAIASDTGLPRATSSIAFTTANSPFPATSTCSCTATNTPISSSAPAGETAGIAVGTVAGTFGLLGVILFMCIRKKRRSQNHQWESQQIATGPGSPSSSMFSARRLSPAPAPTPAPSSRNAQMTGSNIEPSLLSLSRGPVVASSTKTRRSSFAPGVYAAIAPIIGQRESQSSPGDQNRRSFWRKSIRPEEIGVAVSPKEGTGFFRRSNPSSRRKTRSMMPIPESSVLPTLSSPTDSEDEASTGFAPRNSVRAEGRTRRDTPNAVNVDAPLLKAKKESRPFSFDKSENNSDIEAQNEGLTSSIRGSLLSSTRASIANIGALLARKVSIKRDHAPPRPLILGSPKPSRKATQPPGGYPLTPNYDNGTFIASPSAVPYDPPSGNSLEASPQHKIPRKPTFSSFLRGTLLPTSILMSPPAPKPENDDERPRPPFSRQNTETYPGNNDQNNAASTEDTSPPDEVKRKSIRTSKSPGMLPAPLSIKKASTHRSRRSSIGSPIRSLRYTRVPSTTNMSSFAVKSRASRSPSSKSRLMEEIPKNYTDRPLPSLASLSNFDPVRAAATSPSPVGPVSNTSSRPLSPIDTSPRGKPGFPSMVPSLTSIYTNYKSPTLPPLPRGASTFVAPPPLPLGEASNTYAGHRGTMDMFSPDSAISGRNSETPKWVVTPNRTKTGDLVLTVGDM